jgi:hypothetical protein
MAFNDKVFKDILQKTIEIEKWAILTRDHNGTIPLCKELNLYDILDELKNDGKDGYANELERTRDELSSEAQNRPTYSSSQTAFGLFKKLRRIIEDRTNDSKKLLLYADSIEDLIKDDTELYPQIWRGDFIKVVDIVLAHFVGVDYDLFGELLDRIRVKNPTAATQILDNYGQLQKLSNNGKNAHEKELRAVKEAARKLVSLMREAASEPDQKAIEEQIVLTAIGSKKGIRHSELLDNPEIVSWDFLKPVLIRLAKTNWVEVHRGFGGWQPLHVVFDNDCGSTVDLTAGGWRYRLTSAGVKASGNTAGEKVNEQKANRPDIYHCQTPDELAKAIDYHLKQGGMRRVIINGRTGIDITKTVYDDFETRRLYGIALSQYNKIRKSYPKLPLPQIDTSDPLSALAQLHQLCVASGGSKTGEKTNKKVFFRWCLEGFALFILLPICIKQLTGMSFNYMFGIFLLELVAGLIVYFCLQTAKVSIKIFKRKSPP